jgi:hypothetical protein
MGDDAEIADVLLHEGSAPLVVCGHYSMEQGFL